MSGVSFLTVSNKVALFKKEEPATSIELIQFNEVGFECVAQKDLYNVGDQVCYIEPDYSVPDTLLFEPYIRPNGDPSKSKLGSNNRIKAIKFNLHRGDGMNVYSQGILIPLDELNSFIEGQTISEETDWAALLRITKWEAPEQGGSVKVGKYSGRGLPSGVYKTDETNIEKIWNTIKWPIELYGTEKIDGSSITIYVINGKGGICSRSIDKNIFIKHRIGERKKTWLEKLMFWKKIDIGIYEEVLNDGDYFVKYGYPYLCELLKYCADTNDDNIILRGELCGKGLKGSGNPKNPHADKNPQILFFGMDKYISGVARPQPGSKMLQLLGSMRYENKMNPWNTPYFAFSLQKFNSKEELMKVCNDYFKDHFIEGIVVRNEANTFSAKIMNLAYDEKK